MFSTKQTCIRKLLNSILELLHLVESANASHPLDILLASCLWDKAKRIGKEFLKNPKCAVLWFFAEVPELYILRELHDTVKNILEEIVTGGRDRILKEWKKDRNEAAKVHTGDLFKHFRPLEQVPLTIPKRPDGTVTGGRNGDHTGPHRR